MATSTQQLQQALAQASGAPKPVAMETLPEAEINVRGGTDISLQLEALGTGRKKKQELPVSSASGAIAIQDLYGDLLDGIDYDDPVSVEDFKTSVYERTLDLSFDKTSFDYLDLPALPQAPSSIGVEDEGGEDFESLGGDGGTGVDSFTSGDYSVSPTAGSSFVAQYGPSLAGSAISGDFDLGSTATSFGISSALSGSTTGQIASGLQSGLSAYTSGFSINNPLDAINLASNLYSVASGITSLQNIADVPGEIASGISKIGETISDLVTDPLGTITTGIQQAGNQLEFGTANPTINTVSGFQEYSFVTGPEGKLTVPGMVGALAGPLGSAVNLATGIMGEVGYFDEVLSEYQTEQTIGASNNYSSVTSTVDIGTAYDTSLAAIDGSIGKVSVDLSNLTPGQVTAEDVLDNLYGASRHSELGFAFDEEMYGVAEEYAQTLNDAGDWTSLTAEQKVAQELFSDPLTEMIDTTAIDQEAAQERARREAVSAATASVDAYFDADLDPSVSIGNVGTGFGLEEAYTDLTGSTTIGYDQQTQETMGTLGATAAAYNLSLDIEEERNLVVDIIDQGDGVDPSAPGGPATGPETGLDPDELESRMEDINKFGEPVDDPSAQPYDAMSRDLEASRPMDATDDTQAPGTGPGAEDPAEAMAADEAAASTDAGQAASDPSMGAVDPGDTFDYSDDDGGDDTGDDGPDSANDDVDDGDW